MPSVPTSRNTESDLDHPTIKRHGEVLRDIFTLIVAGLWQVKDIIWCWLFMFVFTWDAP